jgi:Protein of unknown function (DUF1553)/Protein of unknown function (DUF1549)/Bacterial Ig-like domain (group 2)
MIGKRRRNHGLHGLTRIKDQESPSMTRRPVRLSLRDAFHIRRHLSLSVVLVLSVVPSLFFSFTSCYADSVVPSNELEFLPRSARLVGPHARQRFVVERIHGGVGIGDVTSSAEFATDNPHVAVVGRDGFVRPVGDGMATITAAVDGHVARAFVSVEEFARDEPWSFRNHVEPVLTKQGCNSGACHGAAAGKNGFRLTLRGYAPEIDYAALTRQSLGRRVIKTAPQESLILLKPTGAIEHGGGVRFKTDSLEYCVISEWIAAGMPGPSAADAEVRGLTVYPTAVRLAPGQTQQVLVQASYSDGRVDDVTHWAKFASTDDSVASVDDAGRLKVTGRGEGYVSVWFASRVARVTVTSPFETKLEPNVFASAPRNNPIDEKNLAKLASLRIPPSPDAGDAAFLRRAYLDATGTLPTVQEVEAFLNDRAPNRRAKLVDRLLESPEYVDYWAYKWSDLLLVSSRKLAGPSMWSFYRFVRESVAKNVPWDRFARSILTVQGSTLSHGAGAFYVLHRDPIDLTESASMAFLGLSLTCARCHNHPLEKWTQDQYYSFVSLFARVHLKDGDTTGDAIVTNSRDGEIRHPRRGVAMPPAPLDAAPVSADDPRDRRAVLADWLARPDNPYFARAVVNRIWSNFFGRGLVDPEDDLRVSNPPSDEALLDWLVADFVAHRYDMKHLVRTIMDSAVYARSSVPIPSNESDAKFLSHYRVKRLPAEVLLDAISRVTEVSTPFSGYPAGWRSLQLPDSQVASTFLDSFGRPPRIATCSCERSAEPSMSQALHLANGGTINEKLRSDSSAVAKAVASKADDAAIVDRLFLSALARRPSATERERTIKALKEAKVGVADSKAAETARRQAVEDLYWAVLTSREFLFNH